MGREKIVYGRLSKCLKPGTEAATSKGVTENAWKRTRVAGKPILVKHNWSTPGVVGHFRRGWIEEDKTTGDRWACIEGAIDESTPHGLQASRDVDAGVLHSWSISLVQGNPELGLVGDETREVLEGSLVPDPFEEGTQIIVRHSADGKDVKVESLGGKVAVIHEAGSDAAPAAATQPNVEAPEKNTEKAVSSPAAASVAPATQKAPEKAEQKTAATLAEERAAPEVVVAAPAVAALAPRQAEPQSPPQQEQKQPPSAPDTEMADAASVAVPATNTPTPAAAEKASSAAASTPAKPAQNKPAGAAATQKNASTTTSAASAKKTPEAAPAKKVTIAPAKEPVHDEIMTEAEEQNGDVEESNEDAEQKEEEAAEKEVPAAKKAQTPKPSALKAAAQKAAGEKGAANSLEDRIAKVAEADPEIAKMIKDMAVRQAKQDEIIQKMQAERAAAEEAERKKVLEARQADHTMFVDGMKEAEIDVDDALISANLKKWQSDEADDTAVRTIQEKLLARVAELVAENQELKKTRRDGPGASQAQRGGIDAATLMNALKKAGHELEDSVGEGVGHPELKRKQAGATTIKTGASGVPIVRTSEVLVQHSRSANGAGAEETTSAFGRLEQKFKFDPAAHRRAQEQLRAKYGIPDPK